MNFIITLLILIIILGIIIAVHEFGHFIAAKRGGVYVDEFSLGMGPAIYQYKPKKSETTYSLRLLPIGGFVSMAEKENKELKIKKDKVLENKSFFRKFLVLINGILFNCLLAIVLFFISALIYGEPISEPIVKEVTENSAAYEAGITSGDKIIEVNGVTIYTWDDFILEALAKKLKDSYVFTVKKADGSIKSYTLSPKIIEENGENVRKFGIAPLGVTYYKGFSHAVSYGINGFTNNLVTIFKIIGSLFTGEVAVNSLSGPVGIYSLIDSVKSQGFEMLIYLTAYLSINVAIINLIPIPVFDGGRILLLFIEAITKRKTNEKTEIIVNYIGFGLMIILMLYVTFNDIIRLVVN
ncbi:MAG: RIP metalloprotease RseP [Tenericutes bacterium]|nr:RIP metalloprotease RseP [Mycoplasmatota bacterium]